MLAIPHYGLNYAIDNWSAGTPTTTPGASFTLGNSNSKTGTETALLSALAADGYWIEVRVTGTAATGVDTSALIDILYDPAGGTSWSVLIPNLLAGYSAAVGTALEFSGLAYAFPLYIPKGSTIGVRGQTIRSSGTNTCVVAVSVFGGSSRPGFWYGTRVTDIGSDTANSAGLDHTPGNSGTYSSWTDIGGASNPAFGFLTMGLQGSSATETALVYHSLYGRASTAFPGAAVRYGISGNEVGGIVIPHRGVFANIPASTQLQIQATSSGTSVAKSYVLYGVS